jgi:alpha-glucosidase
MDRNQSVKPIYLPPGTWTDYFRGTVYQGGQTIAYPVNSATWDDIPLFIKSGAIIPRIPVMHYVGEKPIRTVSVDIFPSAAPTRFTYYDDDGITYGYEKGRFFSQAITVRANKRNVALWIAPKTGTYAPALREYLCQVHGRAAKSVQVNGKTVPLGRWGTGQDIYGPVTWVKVPEGEDQRIVLQ